MRKSSIEDKIKEKLHGYSAEVDNDQLFQALGVSEKQEKKRVIAWWITGILAILASLFLVAYLFFNEKNAELVETSMKEKQSELIEDKSIPQSDETEQEIILETERELSILDTEEGRNNSDQITDNKLYAEKTLSTLQHESVLNSESNMVTKSYTPNIATKIIDEQVDSPENRKLDLPITIDLLSSISPNTQNIPKSKNPQSNINSISNEKLQIENANEIKSKDVIVVADSGTASIADVDIDPINTLSDQQIHYSAQVPMLQSELEKIKIPSNKFAMQAYAGVGYFTQDFSSNENPRSEYTELRNNSENPLESIFAGIQLKYRIKKGLRVGTGIQWTRLNTEHKYNYSTMKDTVITGVSFASINLFGDTTNVQRGLVSSTTMINREYTFYNAYSSIEIPLSIQYDFTVKRFVLSPGIQWNTRISSWYDGTIINENNELQKGKEYYDEKAVQFSIQPSLSVGYKLTPSSRLIVQGAYYKPLSSLANSDYSLNHNAESVGLLIGYEYVF